MCKRGCSQYEETATSSEPPLDTTQTWNPKAASSSQGLYKPFNSGMAQEQGTLVFLPILYLPVGKEEVFNIYMARLIRLSQDSTNTPDF